jgi:hypothetical protein
MFVIYRLEVHPVREVCILGCVESDINTWYPFDLSGQFFRSSKHDTQPDDFITAE